MPTFADPSPPDAKCARSAVRSRNSKLDLEIQSLELALHALRLEREECYQLLNSYRYPVLTLPHEVTSEIFTRFLPYPRCSLVGPRSPSFLCLICREWREVALSTPALWSAITLILNDPDLYPDQLRLLEFSLGRSGNRSLFIELVCEMDAGVSITPLVEAIVRHASRWEDVNLCLPREGLRLIRGNMPRLRTLAIAPSDILDETSPTVELFTQAPNLMDVTPLVYFNPFVPIPAIPPLLHLRSLYVWSFEGDPESPHPQHLFQALTLPALEVLSAFEPYLGPDPVATISALRPREYPQRIEIFTVRTTSDVAPRDIYAAAFPEAELRVELAY
ncbi:hypothetical protein B0H13DRAFT_2020344 [Mycena leptocephala]|nr:hypothetical protein B0H13DRAFT_2020344 [Mycena leptocephala]